MTHPTKIFGHNEQLKILNESYHVQFPHAWIFNGIKGIGKYSTAVSFIKSICKTPVWNIKQGSKSNVR